MERVTECGNSGTYGVHSMHVFQGSTYGDTMKESETIQVDIELDVPPHLSDAEAAQVVRGAIEELDGVIRQSLLDDVRIDWNERNFLVELGLVPILFKIGGTIGAAYVAKKLFSSVVNVVEEIAKEDVKVRAEAERQRIRAEIERELAEAKAKIEIEKERQIRELRAASPGRADGELLPQLRIDTANGEGRVAVEAYIRMHFRLRGYS